MINDNKYANRPLKCNASNDERIQTTFLLIYPFFKESNISFFFSMKCFVSYFCLKDL